MWDRLLVRIAKILDDGRFQRRVLASCKLGRDRCAHQSQGPRLCGKAADQLLERGICLRSGISHQFQKEHHGRQVSLRPRPFERELGSGLLPAFAFDPQKCIGWQADVVEKHLVEFVRTRQVYDRFDRDARRIHRNHELRQSGLSLAACFAADKGNHELADMRAGGPHFLAVDDPIVAVTACRRADRGKVRTRARFAKADAGKCLAAGNRGYPAPLQPVVAETQQQRPALPVRDPVRPDRGTSRQQFFDHYIAFELAALVPPVLLGPRHAEQARITQFAAEGGVRLGPAVCPANRISLAVLRNQITDLVAQARRRVRPVDRFGCEGLHRSPLRCFCLQFLAAPQDPLHHATNPDRILRRENSWIPARREKR